MGVLAGIRNELVACPICDERIRPKFSVNARIGGRLITIGECRNCRLALQVPRVPPEDSVAYMDSRWSSTDPEDRYVTDPAYKLEASRRRLAWLAQFPLPSKRLLDVGAGNGAFCAAALSAGYHAAGVEISVQAIRRAEAMYGVKLVHGSVESLPDDVTFGIVTLWDVIEHLRDPLSVLRCARRRLVQGGMIVVETGNYESGARLVERNEWGLWLLDHMYYFSPDSLRALLLRAGFRDATLHPLNLDAQEPSRSPSVPDQVHRAVMFQKIVRLLTRPRSLYSALYSRAFKMVARMRWPAHWNLYTITMTAYK